MGNVLPEDGVIVSPWGRKYPGKRLVAGRCPGFCTRSCTGDPPRQMVSLPVPQETEPPSGDWCGGPVRFKEQYNQETFDTYNV
jgi:hypothetical protein